MKRTRLIFAAAVAVVVLAPFVLPAYYVTLLNYIGLATLVTLGLVVMTGVGGIVSFGQQAFVGIAAYATAALTTMAGWSPWAGLAASLALVAISALLIGAVTLRLSGHYLTIATIAWGIAIYHLFGNLPLFIGSRNNASLRYKGLVQTIFVRGGTRLTDTERQAAEQYVAGLIGVTLP